LFGSLKIRELSILSKGRKMNKKPIFLGKEPKKYRSKHGVSRLLIEGGDSGLYYLAERPSMKG